ncbi:MAG TPA: hypothetical protein VGK23_12725 [Methanomassiliicoccales archaeon]
MFGKPALLSNSTLTVEEQRYLRHTNAMLNILGMMIDYEDSNKTAMTQEQIVGSYRNADFNAESVLFEMLDLAYVSCSVIVSPEQRSKNVQVKSICYAWGTTFFGREWYVGSKTKRAGS